MVEGIRCPPATHAYKPLGKVIFCPKCGDVQALFLETSDAGVITASGNGKAAEASQAAAALPEAPEPTSAEMEAHIRRLREAAGLAEQQAQQTELNLGQRHEYEGDLSYDALLAQSNERELRRVRVDEGFETDPRSDRVPDAGL